MHINKKATLLILLMAVSMIAMGSLVSTKIVSAEPIPKTTDGEVVYAPSGATIAANLTNAPEYLAVWTMTYIHSTTTIIVQGTDALGAPIEARATIPASTAPENTFVLNDTHTHPYTPVAFATLTGIFQENGTNGDQVELQTWPSPWVGTGTAASSYQQYLGTYHVSPGWEPGQCHPSYPDRISSGLFLQGHGPDTTPTWVTYAPEPSTPSFIKVLTDWEDGSGGNPLDLVPQSGEWPTGGASVPTSTVLTITGLDQYGNLFSINITVHHGDEVDYMAQCVHSFTTICTVSGGWTGDSYYIFTEPGIRAAILYYTIMIDYASIQPASYDILANPQVTLSGESGPQAVGNTTVTVTLLDQDGNIVNSMGGIEVNFETTGGFIRNSTYVWIPANSSQAKAVLTADTNPRTIRVSAEIFVPSTTVTPGMYLHCWTQVDFDGISSVGPPAVAGYTTITTLMWGYTNRDGGTFTAAVPPEPAAFTQMETPLQASEGADSGQEILNGPVYEVTIPLYAGCNLISCPVHPIMCTCFNTSGDTLDAEGIPMGALFNRTSATTTITAIWEYTNGNWYFYIPGIGGDIAYFTDGVGYWIYAYTPCSLEISGISMDNAMFTPPGFGNAYPNDAYELFPGWNLIGYTSTINGMSIASYFESVNTGATGATTFSAIGPVWTYYAYARAWFRDPPWGLYPGYGMWVYNKLDTELYIAP